MRARAARASASGRHAWVITALLGVVYLILAPSSPDLAAADYRSSVFAHAGLSLWDNSWYGGHHLLAYSLLAPGLGALVGPQLLAAVSMVAATALFALVIEDRFPRRATRLAAAWFAIGASIGLLSSRVAFDLGLAIGLGCLLAAQRRRTALALVLAVLCALASPVAGAFLALAGLAWAIVGGPRAPAVGLTVLALAPIALLSFVFPEGGTQPFDASAFYPALAGVAVVGALIPSEHRELYVGALLYALALVGSYVIATAVGGNVDRLGALVAGPVLACVLAGGALAGRRARLLLVLAPLFLYWQANAPVADFAAAISDPAVKASYYAPLLGELRALGVGYGARPARIEVVATEGHWDARWVAPHAMLARGWERQLDRFRNDLFYESAPPSAASYEDWLARTAVSYIALPDSPLDYSAVGEAALLRGGSVGGVREIWHSRHWRLFAVLAPRPLAQPPAVAVSIGSDSMTIAVPRPGSYTVRVRFTPYWALASGAGCLSRAGEDWTQLRARSAGSFHIVIRFSLERVFSRGPRCD
jgi:hypothetical protein